MALLDELRELAGELSPSQFPTAHEVEQILAALIYYVDTRLNLAPGPEGTSADPWKEYDRSRKGRTFRP